MVSVLFSLARHAGSAHAHPDGNPLSHRRTRHVYRYETSILGVVEKSQAHLSKCYPMHPMFKAVLEAIVQSGGRVFSRWTHHDSGTDIGPKTFKAAKMPSMTLHKMRYTFATLLMYQ